MSASRVDEVTLKLGIPHGGWLPVTLQVGSFTFDQQASHVLNDPVLELFDCMEFAVDGSSGFRRVCFWLEPPGYALDVQAVSDEDVMLTVWSAESFVPPMSGEAMLLEYRCVCPRLALVRALHAALAGWLVDQRPHLRAHWARNELAYDRALGRVLRVPLT